MGFGLRVQAQSIQVFFLQRIGACFEVPKTEVRCSKNIAIETFRDLLLTLWLHVPPRDCFVGLNPEFKACWVDVAKPEN